MLDPLQQIYEMVHSQGGLYAQELVDSESVPKGGALPQLERLLTAPLTVDDPGPYMFALEAVNEGFRLHHGGPRLFVERDPELALLLGDWLYAQALNELSRIGDLAAIEVLGQLISVVSQAEFVNSKELINTAWSAAIAAIGWGASSATSSANALASRLSPEAASSLQNAAKLTFSLR